MKTDFATLMKELRITLHPMFKSLTSTPGASLDTLEQKKNEMLKSAGYSEEEYSKLESEYYLDFSAEKPEDWVIRHDPEHATIITHK